MCCTFICTGKGMLDYFASAGWGARRLVIKLCVDGFIFLCWVAILSCAWVSDPLWRVLAVVGLVDALGRGLF
jgi:hypothetical protein